MPIYDISGQIIKSDGTYSCGAAKRQRDELNAPLILAALVVVSMAAVAAVVCWLFW